MPVCPPTKAVALVNFSSADALSVGSHPVFAAFAPSSSLTRMASALWTDGTALVLPVHARLLLVQVVLRKAARGLRGEAGQRVEIAARVGDGELRRRHALRGLGL